MVARYDNITIKAELTSEGWIVDKPVITRAGIFTYHNGVGKVVKEYRPDDEVFKADSLQTLLGAPITDGHNGILNTDSSLDGVVIGSVLTPGEREDTNVVASIVIHNVKKIGSRRDLSLGYQCRIDETPGEYSGEKYDCIQRDIRYNHLAVVNKGRAGNARLRLDADDYCSFPVEDEMPETTLQKLRLDSGLEYSAAPEVLVYVHDLNSQIKALKTELDKAGGERDAAKSAYEAAVQSHKEALEAGNKAVRERLKLEDTAEKAEVKADGLSDRDLKIAVLAKMGVRLDFADRSDDYVDSAYDMTLANETSKAKVTARQKTTTTTKQDSGSGTTVSSSDARARMIARIRGEKEAA